MKTFRTTGFSLIEVTLALGVSSFAMLAIFGLLPVGLNSSQTAAQQTVATNLATAIVTDMKQVPSASAITASSTLKAVSSKYGIDVSGTGSTFYADGSGALANSGTAARYKVSVKLAQPASGSKQASNGSITVAWPAAAVNPLDKISAFVALDRN